MNAHSDGERAMTDVSAASEFLTEAELQGFVMKLEDFCRGLDAREQAFLAAVVEQAVAAGDGDVQGYSINYNASKSNTGNLSDPDPNALPATPPLTAEAILLKFSLLNTRLCASGKHI
jgi:hypothetical protein